MNSDNQGTTRNEIIKTAKTEILAYIDEICASKGIEYFAIGKLLMGCVHYHDIYEPDTDKAWQIALIRNDYDKLMDILRSMEHAEGIRLRELKGKGKRERYYETIYLQKHVPEFEEDGEDPYVGIAIHPFDRMPVDESARAAFIRNVNMHNEFLKILTLRKPLALDEMSPIERFEFKLINKHSSNVEQYQRIQKIAARYKNDKKASIVGQIAIKQTRALKITEIFPLKRIEFRGMMLPCPRDCSIWTLIPSKEHDQEVQSVQAAELRILKEFDRVCRENDLRYFSIGGTTLGAVRHGGMIPWDDDIDVGILRADYDKFLQIAKDSVGEEFFVQTIDTDPELPFLYAKLQLKNTSFVTRFGENRAYRQGIFIDIFPLDALPADEEECKNFVDEATTVERELRELYFDRGKVSKRMNTPHSLLDIVYHISQSRYLKRYDKNWLRGMHDKYNQIVTRYNDRIDSGEIKSVAYFSPEYIRIDLDCLFPLREVEFEDTKIFIPNKPEVLLQNQYGDYNKMPPAHQRMGHHVLYWSTEKELK